jgi:hypothetical protein
MAMKQSRGSAVKECMRYTRESVNEDDRLSCVHPSERVLLISHCLRSSKGCMAKIEAWGVDCVGCNPSCQVNRLKTEALDSGYKAVCIAPGGSLALKFIREHKPRGIVAIACKKELEEGIENVRRLSDGEECRAPAIVIVPLTKDGCVDTEVDMETAIGKILLGVL